MGTSYLILEDSPSAMMDLITKFKIVSPKATLHEAHTYEEAAEILAKFSIDVAFIDLSMPKKNGMDFIVDKLKSENDESHVIPIVVITGVDQNSLLRTSLKGIAHRVLSKPVDLHMLQEAVDSLNN